MSVVPSVVVSATTRGAVSAARPASGSAALRGGASGQQFVVKAAALLEQAWAYHRAGDAAAAVEAAYLAAIKLAGARTCSVRRRSGASAWDLLAKKDAAGREQAAQFRPVARLYMRIQGGLELAEDELFVRRLLVQVEDFLGFVRGESTPAARAA